MPTWRIITERARRWRSGRYGNGWPAYAWPVGLDGCYVLKTDLPAEVASKELVHARYRDLAQVEKAFRTMKTGHLELRPVYVRKASSTRGHVLVVMLAYLIQRELARAWRHLNLTVEEGLRQLSNLCAVEVVVKGQATGCVRIPEPGPLSGQLLSALDLRMPSALAHRPVPVVTKRKLQERRQRT